MILNLISILRRSAGFILLVIILTACKSIAEASPPPTPAALRLAYAPALRPWVGRLAACAEKQPEAAMFLEEVPVSQFGANQYDAVLRLGGTPNPASYAVILGYDKLKIIVNAKNPVTSLNKADLSDLFDGSLATWELLSPPNGVYVVSVQVWSYLPESELANLTGSYLRTKITNAAHLASHPGQVIEAVVDEPGAVGLVSDSWLVDKPEGVKTIDLPGEFLDQQIPVLAVTNSEPQGSLRTLLACVSKDAK